MDYRIGCADGGDVLIYDNFLVMLNAWTNFRLSATMLFMMRQMNRANSQLVTNSINWIEQNDLIRS